MLIGLRGKFEKFWPYQVTFDSVLTFLPFFKIYFQYCADYDRGVKSRSLLLTTSPEYAELV